ncbi:MAG: hypothetical protein J0L96_03255, partial [Anaerolineae bacterium]|nr:hypothetical protein [Anaerolineae bacterium]
YTYYGIDEMGTYAVTGEGDYNKDTKILTLSGSTIDPSGKTSEPNIETILSDLRSTGAQVIIALLDDQSQRPVALRGEAFTAITPDELAMMSEQVKRYNAIIQSQAAQYGALTVDFYNSDIFIIPATLADDGNHPNAAGYDLITQAWYKALITILP